MKNTDRLAIFVADKVIDSMQSRFKGKVSGATFDTVRSGAIRTASNAIPFPLRLAVNAIPNSVFEKYLLKTEGAVARVIEDGIKTINPKSLSNTTDVSAVVAEVVKTAMSRGMETVNGFIKGRPVDQSTDRNDVHGDTRPITFTCPNPDCRRPFKVDAKFAGKKAKCDNCGTVVTIPAISVPPPVKVQPLIPVNVPPPVPPPVPTVMPVVDPNSSIEKVREKASSGDINALRELSMAYLTGTKGVDQSIAEAMRWLEEAAKLGDAASQFDLADCLRAEGDDNKAFYWDQKAAEQGYAKSQYNLGVCFRDGIGTPVNPDKQFFWFQQAANNGLTEAKLSLAVCHLLGTGTPQDFQQAIYWLQQAADEGNAEAKRRLGLAYIQGVGCSVDVPRGLALLRDAASLEDEKAKEILVSDEVLDLTDFSNATEDQQRAFAIRAAREAEDTAALGVEYRKKLTKAIVGGIIGGVLFSGLEPSNPLGGVLFGFYFGFGLAEFFGRIVDELQVFGVVVYGLADDNDASEPYMVKVVGAFFRTLVFYVLIMIPFWFCIAPITTIIKLVKSHRQSKQVH